MKKYQTEQMADFVRLLSSGYLASDITEQLKRHLLDALGSLIYAQTSPTILRKKEIRIK